MDREKFKDMLDNNNFIVAVDERSKVIKRKINKDGAKNILVHAMEELAELIQEISKAERQKLNKVGLLEELADTLLYIEAVKFICGIDDHDLQNAINIKLRYMMEGSNND